MKTYKRLFDAIRASKSTFDCIGVIVADAVNAYLSTMILIWLANVTKGGPDQFRWIIQSVIANHKIAECGTHEELVQLGGIYTKLQK